LRDETGDHSLQGLARKDERHQDAHGEGDQANKQAALTWADFPPFIAKLPGEPTQVTDLPGGFGRGTGDQCVGHAQP